MDLMTYVLSKRNGQSSESQKEPVLDGLYVDSNGTFIAGQGTHLHVDGWNQIDVDVQPNLDGRTFHENGDYYASDYGFDGFNTVTVEVDGPSLGTLEVGLIPINNSDTNPATGSIIDSDTYEAQNEGLDGWNEVTVPRIPLPPVLGTINITENGQYDPMDYKLDPGNETIKKSEDIGNNYPTLDGFAYVTVNIPESNPVLETLNITENGIYQASDDGYYGFEYVTVNVPPKFVKVGVFTQSLNDPLSTPVTVLPLGDYSNTLKGYIQSNGLVNVMAQARSTGQLLESTIYGNMQLTFQGMGTQLVPVTAILGSTGSTSILNIYGGAYDSVNDVAVYYSGIIDDTDTLQFTKLVIIQNGTAQDLTTMASQFVSNLSLNLYLSVNFLAN